MATTTKRKLPESYYERVREFPLLSITTAAELVSASTRLDAVLAMPEDPGTTAYLSALTDLVEAYERDHCDIPEATEVELLQHLLEAREISAADLARETTIDPATLSAVLAGTRSLTGPQRKKLARFFGIRPEAFIAGALSE